MPQENGNRTDVRWMYLNNPTSKDGLLIVADSLLIQMGVGGNDSWSDVAAPLEQYQIKAKDYHYSFYIVPFNAKNKTAGERAKEIR